MKLVERMTNAIVYMLISHGLRPVREYRLPNGRRLDVAAISNIGWLCGVEIKSSEADFVRDLKWPDAMRQCKIYYIAVPQGFNQSLIHPGVRVVTVDGDNARITRRSGRGLARASSWHQFEGAHAVNPAVPGASLRYAPSGDDAPAKLILP